MIETSVIQELINAPENKIEIRDIEPSEFEAYKIGIQVGLTMARQAVSVLE